MDPEQLIESYRRQEALFRKAVQDPDQVADEVLLAVCRHDYFDYRSTDEGAVRYCFLELIEHRYGERVYTICYNLSGRNDYRALELRDYVFERLEKKLDSGFLPQFEVRQDFGKYFACTLAYYIRRYLLPDFYSIRAAQNISDYDLMAKKQLVSHHWRWHCRRTRDGRSHLPVYPRKTERRPVDQARAIQLDVPVPNASVPAGTAR